MHKFASFNHEIFPASKININSISSAALYGKGIFTTLAIYNTEPFLWEKHWCRLIQNAGKLSIDLSFFIEKKVKDSLYQIIEKNKFSNGRCRLTFFDESSSKIWQTKSKNKTSLLIQSDELREVKQNISLTVSPFQINSTSPLAGVKSCNYLENILALENARFEGFDEAVRLNERSEITSACMANIFWIKGERLFTPSLETGCLAGTTREFVLENQEVSEVKENFKTLEDADAIFLTSAGIGLCLASIDEKREMNSAIFTEVKKTFEAND